MVQKTEQFLDRYPWLAPALLFLLFVLVNLPGLSWGLPDSWHPDELIQTVDWALQGDYQFDQENFTYPSLPRYVMYGLGTVVYSLGGSTWVFHYAARFLTVILGGLVVLLTYAITRQAGGRRLSALVAALLVITCSEFSMQAHLAHNDIYVTLFDVLAVLLVLRFREKSDRRWLYLSFFSVGLAASSKYTGGALILVLYLVYLVNERKAFLRDLLRSVETLFISTALAFLGYALGTPKALTWMAFYFKRVFAFLQAVSTYDITPGTRIGLFSQWQFFINAAGMPVFLLVMIACAGFLGLWTFRLIRRKPVVLDQGERSISILLLAILVLDLPLLISYNVQMRYWLPMFPLLFCLSALFLETVTHSITRKGNTRAASALIVAILIFTLLPAPRVVSTVVLLQNDARIPAGEFIAGLPAGTTLEFTLYPPNLPDGHFSRVHQYPIYFKKYPDAELPTSPYYVYNRGEAGLDERHTDYLVLDSFTYERFESAYTCELHQVECDFFRRLLAGETAYRLIADFRYELPWFLPRVSPASVNPEILIFERLGK